VSLLGLTKEKSKNEFNGFKKYFQAFHLKLKKTVMMVVYLEPDNICVFVNFLLTE